MSVVSPPASPPPKKTKRRVSFSDLHPPPPSINKTTRKRLVIPKTFLGLVFIYVSAAISVFVVRYNVTLWDTVDLARRTMLSMEYKVGRGRGREKNVVFVHVGKTGGTTIGSMLKVLCESRTKQDSRENCFREWQHRHGKNETESRLSSLTTGFVHVTGFYPTQQAMVASHYLISLRHPVERVVSWFYYLHPMNCYTVDNVPTPRQSYTLIDKACVTKRIMDMHKNSREAKFYQQCFSQGVDQFARAFSTNADNTISKECQQLALEMLQGYGGPNGMAGHLWANYSYYYKVMKPRKPILAVRTTHLWDDLQQIEHHYLGGTGQVFAQQKQIEIQQKQQQLQSSPSSSYHKDPLSPEGYAALCCALLDDMTVSQSILQSAVNLDGRQIQETLVQETYQKCHPTLQSLSDLRQYCSNTQNIIKSS